MGQTRSARRCALERELHVNGVRLWTKRHGRGPPLLLLHGGPGLWDDFDALAAMVEDVVCVHRYDQRGGGRSEHTPPYDVATLLADLEALRTTWGHERWIVAGHSFGVGLALAYAVAHPERVRALIGLAGTGVVDDWRAEYHANADARLSAAQREQRDALEARLAAGNEKATPEQHREYCALNWAPDFADRNRAVDLARERWRPWGPSYVVNELVNADWKRMLAEGFAERVRGIDVPVLLVHGAEDPRPPRLSERLAASLPKAKLIILAGAGHWPWLERPARVRKILRGFLSSLPGPQGVERLRA